MYGITGNGFNRKTYGEIIADMEAQAKELFGEDIDLSERNPLAKSLQNVGWEISTLWELAEDVYNSAFIDSSEDLSLDNVGKYVSISRKPAQPSVGVITIKGDEGTKVYKGFRVSTEITGIIFYTDEDCVIGEDGETDVDITSVEPGIKANVPSATITKIVNPMAGVKEVTNKKETADGQNVESDKDFRERYYRSVSLGGSSTRESVEAALLNIPDITDAFVEENASMEYKEGVPPKSLAPYVFGGKDEQIAKTILSSKAGGIRSFGTTEVSVDDSMGISHIIGFTRPEVLDVYVKVLITKGLGYTEDSDVVKLVLIYIGGLGDGGDEYRGLKLGENVVISKLSSSIMTLPGIDDISIQVGRDGLSYDGTNIEVDKKKIARTSFDKVVVEYV